MWAQRLSWKETLHGAGNQDGTGLQEATYKATAEGTPGLAGKVVIPRNVSSANLLPGSPWAGTPGPAPPLKTPARVALPQRL